MEEEWTDYDGGAVQEWHLNASRIRVESGVTVIPASAFEDCEDLRVVDLNNVSTISKYAFNSCRSLERVIWTTTASSVEIGVGAFEGCKKLEEIDLKNATKVGTGAFSGCEALTTVAIPSSATAVKGAIFSYCKNLAEVELGEGIQRIGAAAFYDCGALVRINIPSSVILVEQYAFSSCNQLAEVGLNEGLQHIGKKAFDRCTSLLRISIPSTTVAIGGHAFDECHQLRHVELREGLQVIGERAFDGCNSLERIEFPSSVTSVGMRAFQECRSLTEVTLREGVHDIEPDAFSNCTILAHINIPPVALVVDIRDRSCQLMRTTMPVHAGRLLVASKWMQYRNRSQLDLAQAKMNEILRRRRQPEGQKTTLIREWFAYYDLLDVTTLLELAIWRSNMSGNEQDAEARQSSRRVCGNDMSVIIPCVLPFLEG